MKLILRQMNVTHPAIEITKRCKLKLASDRCTLFSGLLFQVFRYLGKARLFLSRILAKLFQIFAAICRFFQILHSSTHVIMQQPTENLSIIRFSILPGMKALIR